MLTRILLAAILAGVLSGVFVTAVQAYRVTPLILEAESYENAQGADVTHDHGQKTPDNSPTTAVENVESWGPQDGWERTFYTMMANILVGVSFAFILVAGLLLTKSSVDLQSGLIWGGCGFLVFVLAPNFGLSPELPGMPAAELGARQGWWLMTVVATASALLIFAFRQQLVWLLGGVVLLLAPHVYGAPLPRNHDSLVPANLAAEFAVATIVTSLLFWLVLGGALGWLVGRVTPQQSASI